MPLLAHSPEVHEPRLKLFMYGEPGVGKTMAAIQFPRSYIIDAERGTDHYAETIARSGSVVLKTTSHSELVDQLRALLSEKHDYRTLVIDPISTIYSELLDECERKVGDTNARHFGEAQKHMKRIVNLLTALDMNIVVTAHAKPEYGPNLIRMGTTFDGWRRLPYVFDVVVQLMRDGRDAGARRMARVEKSRIPSFPDGDVFEWSYDAIKARYPQATLERDAGPVPLAEPEQVRRVESLISQLSPERVESLKVDRWFSKAGVSEWSDMPADIIAKCIARLEQEVLRPAA
ncbi:MAG TPA: AAA family ATPase [Phycisphaerales bacterium]|nr:AAA family ATPase [Phycisphaerales bacterium]